MFAEDSLPLKAALIVGKNFARAFAKGSKGSLDYVFLGAGEGKIDFTERAN